jgi:hypothetical protein
MEAHPCPIPDNANTVLSLANTKVAYRVLLVAAKESIEATFNSDVAELEHRKPSLAGATGRGGRQ